MAGSLAMSPECDVQAGTETLLIPKQSQCPASPLDTEHGTLPEVGGWLEHTQHLLTDQTAEQRTEGRPEIFKSLPTLQKLSP